MEFDIEVKHGIGGHIEVYDYSKEYAEYYPEDVQRPTRTDKFKYSGSASINVITKINSDNVELLDVILNDHTADTELMAVDLEKDGYYIVHHFVLPTLDWVNEQIELDRLSILLNYSQLYYIRDNKIYKRLVNATLVGEDLYDITLEEEYEVSIRELIERNTEGTPIQVCKVDIFYTGYLQECYINYCRGLFNKLMAHCRPNCKALESKDESFARDFLWMTLNVIDYLIEFGQYMEAQRLLEEINYCGGFCKNINNDRTNSCGCGHHSSNSGCGCGSR